MGVSRGVALGECSPTLVHFNAHAVAYAGDYICSAAHYVLIG